MKKLLSILAAVGLTATASSAVVACTQTIKASNVTYLDAEGNATKDGSKVAFAQFSKKVSLKNGTELSKNSDGKTYSVFNNMDSAHEGYMAFKNTPKEVTASAVKNSKLNILGVTDITVKESDIDDSDIDAANKLTKDVKADVNFIIDLSNAELKPGNKVDITVVYVSITGTSLADAKASFEGDKIDVKIEVPAAKADNK